MKMYKFFLIIFSLFFLLQKTSYCQKKDTTIIIKDSVKPKNIIIDSTTKRDTLARKRQRDPGKASLYSAIMPGLGQIYNKKYWKLPLVYAAVGIPVYTFFYNKSWYNKTRYALAVVANGSAGNADSLAKVDPKLIYFVSNNDAVDLVKYRDEFRKDQDYSVLFFLLFYALQIVDATVDAHLKDFNVTDDLSMHIKPTLSSAPGNLGLTLLFDLHKPKPKALFDISR